MAGTGADNERQMLGLFLVPGVYLRVLAETVRQLGYNDRQLYQGLDFTHEDLKANDSRVFVTDATLMAQRALEVAGKDGLSFILARELRLTIHGTLASPRSPARPLRVRWTLSVVIFSCGRPF